MKGTFVLWVPLLGVLFLAVNSNYTSTVNSSTAPTKELQKLITEYQSSMTALKEELVELKEERKLQVIDAPTLESLQSSMTALKEELVELEEERKLQDKDAATLESLQSSITALKEELVKLNKERKVQVKDAPTLESQTDQRAVISSKEEPTSPQVNTFPILPKSEFMTGLDSPRKSNETFSACLVWNDDLARLPEWIAYHYQVLRLRHLVFFRDPKSTMDPLPILDRFNDLMKITYWSEKPDVMDPFPGAKEEFEASARSKPSVEVWRLLQVMFYRQCSHYLKSLGATWVYYADTDEFAALNNRAVPDAYNKMKQNGIVLDTIKMAQENENLLNTFQKKRWSRSNCKVLARYRYSSFESPKEEVTKHVPPEFDPYRFVTLRFFHYRGETPSFLGKSIADVSRLTLSNVTRDYNAHGVFGRKCGSKLGRQTDLVTVHHYVGNWEYYERNADTRGGTARDRGKFDSHVQALFNRTISANGHIRLWLQGLVDYIGEEKAMFLLQNTGFPFNESTALPIVEVDHTQVVEPK